MTAQAPLLPRPFLAWLAGLSSRVGGGRRSVFWAKRLLPVAALALLSAIALWPQLRSDATKERMTLRQLAMPGRGGAQLVAPRYRSADRRGRPYTITAASGQQRNPDTVTLARPVGDMELGGALWAQIEAGHGVLRQHDGVMDLSGDTRLYRSDGLTMVTDTATLDTRAGVAASADRTHAEGPFGTLDAQGFSMLDKGSVIQFVGPARLVMQGAKPPAPRPSR